MFLIDHSHVSWNDSSVIQGLFELFLGTGSGKASSSPTVKPESKKEPVSIRIRLKIFPYLMRSTQSTRTLPECMQVRNSASFQFLHKILIGNLLVIDDSYS